MTFNLSIIQIIFLCFVNYTGVKRAIDFISILQLSDSLAGITLKKFYDPLIIGKQASSGLELSFIFKIVTERITHQS